VGRTCDVVAHVIVDGDGWPRVSFEPLSVLSLTMLFVVATSRACPGLSSDQVVASAAARLAGCSEATNAWSKGGR